MFSSTFFTAIIPRSIPTWVGLILAFLGNLDRSQAQNARTPKTQVLVITGGHGFDRPAFFKMFDDNPDIQYRSVDHKKASDSYEQVPLTNDQAIVLYDMVQEITPLQKERFLGLFKNGIGLVVLHHALVSYQDWPEFEKIVGGKYPEDQNHKGAVSAANGYQHDVSFPVEILDPSHPVTKGLPSFTITDEIYWGFRTGKDIHPLLTTTHPKSGKPLAWSRQEKNSRVVYIQLGHGPSAYQDKNYQRILAQAISWVAKP